VSSRFGETLVNCRRSPTTVGPTSRFNHAARFICTPLPDLTSLTICGVHLLAPNPSCLPPRKRWPPRSGLPSAKRSNAPHFGSRFKAFKFFASWKHQIRIPNRTETKLNLGDQQAADYGALLPVFLVAPSPAQKMAGGLRGAVSGLSAPSRYYKRLL